MAWRRNFASSTNTGRWRLTDPTTDGTLLQEPLWYAVVNVVAWLTVFALLATWLVRRGRDRQ